MGVKRVTVGANIAKAALALVRRAARGTFRSRYVQLLQKAPSPSRKFTGSCAANSLIRHPFQPHPRIVS
jgi:hypothetical protein